MYRNGIKVLVVDDETSIRAVLKEFLTRYGYIVDCVSSGEAAITLIETGDYDILITDYTMPGINGIELIKKIRGLRTSLRIIGISGFHNGKDFLTAGAHLFIAKPLMLSELKNALENGFST